MTDGVQAEDTHVEAVLGEGLQVRDETQSGVWQNLVDDAFVCVGVFHVEISQLKQVFLQYSPILNIGKRAFN